MGTYKSITRSNESDVICIKLKILKKKKKNGTEIVINLAMNNLRDSLQLHFDCVATVRSM